ncbi:hypothetical protein K474DRAFT_1656176 [Panus rudis PR-1116 ss-1]|nr:hypothetical protein K474DRAFT_1656176 [Panus rudis PR-1116 ss-1]
MNSGSPQRPRVITSSSYLSVPDARSLSASPSSSPDTSPLLPSALPPHFGRRPSMSRANSQSPSFSQSLAVSQSMPHATPPYLSPQGSSLSVQQPRRLLMPTVRATRHHGVAVSPKVSSSKSSPAKLGRSRASSIAHSVQSSPDICSGSSPYYDWIGGGCKFEVVEDQLELEGFQIYAVEKWIVERRRPVTVLTVYTGNTKDRITVTALAPLSSLTPVEAQAEWDKAMHILRRDGARPRESDKGTIMITSLANFRSDYTIVHIPKGNFLEVREQLYTNIDVLRMGCSGRSALTLEEPSDTTKDRFISMYHIPEKTLTRAQELFTPTVLELVKLLQAALAICGLFDLAPDERNGLLCDVTHEGIERWIADIGEPLLDVEPSERVADPTVVSAIFSVIVTTRNKLHALGHNVPKDPFIDLYSFLKSLASFQSSKPHHSHGHSHNLSITNHTPHTSTHPSTSTLVSSINTSNPVSPLGPSPVFLTRTLIQNINTAYEKFKQSESYKVHKVLINKLDDLATDLRTNPEASTGRVGGWGGWWSAVFNTPTTDLDAFVRIVVLGGNSKESAPSLRYLWTGRPEEVSRKRREKEVLSDNEEEGKGEKEGKEKGYKDEKASEDDSEMVNGTGKPWSGRVQKKIEAWTALGRSKKLSTDLGKGRPSMSPESPPRGQEFAPGQFGVPQVVVSKDPAEEEEVLSSGQQSPTSDAQQRNPFMLNVNDITPGEHSAPELSDYERRISEFNRRRPNTRVKFQSRVNSWSDPRAAREIIDDGTRPHVSSPLSRSDGDGLFAQFQDASGALVDSDESSRERPRARLLTLRERRSFDDADRLKGIRILPVERMRVDVELCGQLLIMRRREQHLADVLACLQVLTKTLSNSNASLHTQYTVHQPVVADLEQRAHVLQDIEALRTKVEAMTQETNALAYESAQFLVDDLWHMASQPRLKVFEMREKVFGTGRKVKQGVHGAHGPFNRIQWSVDGKEKLVDMFGRTESEVEEEQGMPGAHPVREEEDMVQPVEHQSLRPTWLLRMFNYFGGRWGVGTDERSGNGNGKVSNGGAAPPSTSTSTNTGASTSVDSGNSKTVIMRHASSPH